MDSELVNLASLTSHLAPRILSPPLKPGITVRPPHPASVHMDAEAQALVLTLAREVLRPLSHVFIFLMLRKCAR